MNSIPQGTTMVKAQMDRILESAVVLSWKDLLRPSQRGLIHIEYGSWDSMFRNIKTSFSGGTPTDDERADTPGRNGS